MKAKALWAAALAVAACALASAGGVAAQGSARPSSSVVGLSGSNAPALQLPLAVGNWNSATPYPTTIARYAYAQVGQTFYVIGGVSGGTKVQTVRRYSPATDTWTPLANIPVTSEAPAAAYYNGKIYVAEGDTGPSLQIYNIGTNAWTAGAPRPVTNSYGAAAGAYGGKVYVVGGGSGGASTTNSVYDIATNTWSAGTAAPSAILLAGYHQVGHFLYIVGGFGASPAANANQTMRLDMSTGTWTSGPTFTPQRGDFALAAAGSKLYAIGGDLNGNAFFDSSNLVNELDTTTWPSGSWVASPDNLTVERQASEAGFFSIAHGGEIWSTGGLKGSTFTFLPDHLYRQLPVSSCAVNPISKLVETFDGVAAPTLPACWSATNEVGIAPDWVTSNAGTPTPTADSAPNAAFVNDPSTVSDKRLDSPVISLRAGIPTQLTFRQNYNLE
jgi:Kelch motif